MGKGGRSRLRLSAGSEAVSLGGLFKLATVIFVAVVLLSFMAAESAKTENMIFLDDPREYWSVVKSYDKVLVYVGQTGCLGCKKIEPAIERFATEQGEVKVVKVWLDTLIKVDAESTFDLLARLGVEGTPTLIVYRNGVEVARHVSTFGFGDQYGPLKEFVEKSLSGEVFIMNYSTPGQAYLVKDTFDPKLIASITLAGFLLGLVAAFSPCSLPMVAAFASQSVSESLRFKSYVVNLAAILSAAIGFGTILSILYLASIFIPLNIYQLAIYYAASVIIAWGILTLAGKDVMVRNKKTAKILLPVLGLQCSLPFLLTAIALASQAPHLVIAGSIAFAAGYALPYSLAGALGASAGLKIERIMRASVTKYLQGILLVGAGAYLIYYNMPSII
ncbi:thioredoxin [Aeropyrum pernix]|uniref:Thioredoxin n=1 Tax=Aeropyrum pernix TaxID=56636 RepID=A0A401HA19_AERPX|nr:thioredoxin domain-containing protein [Aeropyrum pernix]GBF09306.1 thioredoxin [Aeropyrum pernix]